MSDLPAPKSVILAIGIEAHDFADAISKLRQIEWSLEEKRVANWQTEIEIYTGGWHMHGDVDPERREEEYTEELMAWYDRRKAARRGSA